MALGFGVLVPDAQLSLSSSLSGEAGVLGIAALLPLSPSGDTEVRFLGDTGDCCLDNLGGESDFDLERDFLSLEE